MSQSGLSLPSSSMTDLIIAGNTGSGSPVADTFNIIGTAGTTTNVSGNTLTITAAATGGELLIAEGTLTSAQVKSLRASPVQLIPAPGVGSYILVVNISSKLNYGGTNAFTNPGGGTLSIAYGTFTTGTPILVGSTILTATATTTYYAAGGLSGAVSTTYDNVVLNAYNTNATEFAGNAANNNTITYSILYKIVTI